MYPMNSKSFGCHRKIIRNIIKKKRRKKKEMDAVYCTHDCDNILIVNEPIRDINENLLAGGETSTAKVPRA